MKSLKRFRENVFSWNGLMLGLFSVLTGIFLIVMPKYDDDYWYMLHFVEWYGSQGIHDTTQGGNIFKVGIPWDKVVDTWNEHISSDNIRLGNLVVVLFMLLPKWIGSLLVSLGWIYSMICSLKIAGVNFRKSALVALAIILWGAFVPWTNRMGSEVYQFNYFFATVMSLWLLSLLGIGGEKVIRSRPCPGGLAEIFVVACLAGWWHEGFSIPIFAGLLSLIVLYKECRNKKYVIALSGLFVGIVILVCAPGTGERLNNHADFTFANIKSQILYASCYGSLFFGTVVIIIIAALKHGWRKVFEDKIVIFTLVSGAIPILMSLVTRAEARVMWWTQIISIITILRFLSKLNGVYWGRYRKTNVIWLIALVILTFAHFAVSDYYVFRMRDSQSSSIKAYFANPDKPVFADVILPVNQPLICLRMPDVDFYSIGRWYLSDFIQKQSDGRPFAIIPRELRYVDSKSGRPLEGGASAREYEKRVFMPHDSFCKQMGNSRALEIDFGSGYMQVPYYGHEFESEGDGKRYFYIYLHNSCYSQHFKTIKGLRFVK